MKKFWVALFIFTCIKAKADISLPSIIGSNMVLQQQSVVNLWGWGNNSNEKVVVTTSWNNMSDSTKVDENAKWQLTLHTPAAGGPYTITIKGRNTIVLQNILIGEVWVCSGQSNMEMNYNWGLPQMKADLPTAANNNIRFFTIPHNTALTPQESGRGDWITCDSNTVKSFSAVAYYFGRKLNESLHVPIGLVHASWGGTPAEVWTPAEVVGSNKTLADAAKKLNRSTGWPITPGFTFNGMLAPITSFAVAGAIWYQGESNTGTASTYQQLFTAMIESWRKQWGQDFPFYYVQLAPYKYGNKDIGALLREAQTKTLALSKTGMVVTTDLVDDTTNIHPKNKKDVGLRLALLALDDTYNSQHTGTKSPVFDQAETAGDKLILSFRNAPSGLVVNDKTAGIYIAGNDKVFLPAQVKWVNGKLQVWNKKISQPVAVRYAFSNTAVGNIYGKEGLPLSPFRTDNWEVDTASEK